MAKFKVTELEREEPLEARSGEEIRLRLRPLGRVQKMDIAAAMARGDLGEAERMLLKYCVTGWKGVEDEAGKEIPFAFDALNTVLGGDDAMGAAVHDRLLIANGLAEAGDPLDSTSASAPSSPSTSIAER